MASSACANARCSSEPSSPSRDRRAAAPKFASQSLSTDGARRRPVKSRTRSIGRGSQDSLRDYAAGQSGAASVETRSRHRLVTSARPPGSRPPAYTGLDESDRSSASCATTATSTGSSRKMRSASARSDSRCSSTTSCRTPTNGDARRRSVAIATSVCSPDAIFRRSDSNPSLRSASHQLWGAPRIGPLRECGIELGASPAGGGCPRAGGPPCFVACARRR